MRFSAVILAGGRSARMGRDKAWLDCGGQPLLAHQLATLAVLQPAELLISGHAHADYRSFGLPVVLDRYPDRGPLGGIERALATAAHPLVLVLAVDMPRMNAEFLRRLLERCSNQTGAVPRTNRGLEPLAAVYPKDAATLAVEQIERGCRAAQEFAERCRRSGLVEVLDCRRSGDALFTNWNEPADLECGDSFGGEIGGGTRRAP